jgi:hypothetical protein
MGMFDTFHANWRGKRLELQHKDFECSLQNWNLGDRIDISQFGIGGFISGFQPDINHLRQTTDNGSDQRNDTRFFIGILHNGYWIDYAVAPTFDSAKALLDELIVAYDNPARLALAWQSIHTIKTNKTNALNDILSTFQEFYSAFQSRKIKTTKNSSAFALFSLRNSIPKKDLTFSNLLTHTASMFESWRKPKDRPSDYTFWKQEFSLQNSYYFYDGPDYPAKTVLSNTDSILLKHLSQLNLLFFQAMQSADSTWSSKLSPAFLNALTVELPLLQKTYWGSMAWLNLRSSMPHLPLLPAEATVAYNFHTNATAWLHFVEVIGVDEDWLIDAVAAVPTLLNQSQQPFPLFTLPAHYTKACDTFFHNVDCSQFIDVPDIHGLSPIHYATYGCAHYDTSEIHAALQNVDFCLKNGANPLTIDPQGNTPLMWLATYCGGVNTKWLWQKDNYRQQSFECYSVLKKLMRGHSFTHTNKLGKTLLTLWPKDSDRSLLSEEEREKIMLSLPPSSELPQTNKQTAL